MLILPGGVTSPAMQCRPEGTCSFSSPRGTTLHWQGGNSLAHSFPITIGIQGHLVVGDSYQTHFAWGSHLPGNAMSSRRDLQLFQSQRDDIALARRQLLGTQLFLCLGDSYQTHFAWGSHLPGNAMASRREFNIFQSQRDDIALARR
jgi:hypothetical protein